MITGVRGYDFPLKEDDPVRTDTLRESHVTMEGTGDCWQREKLQERHETERV